MVPSGSNSLGCSGTVSEQRANTAPPDCPARRACPCLKLFSGPATLSSLGKPWGYYQGHLMASSVSLNKSTS